MKTAECYDGYHQTSRTEVSKTLTAGQGFGESSDSIPKVLVRTFNFELFANPPPETVGSLCRTRAGDWMCLCFRCGSFGQFVPSAASGTLECGHSATVGNGTPCLSASEGKGTQGQKDADGGYVLVPFVKTSHARGAGGEGERWEEREVAGTRNVFDGDRPQEVVVHRPRAIALDGDKWKVRPDGNYARKGGNGLGVSEAEVMYTLTTADRHVVAVVNDKAAKTERNRQNG